MSAPLTAGVAALLLAFDPTLTPSELRQLIVAAATSSGHRAQSATATYPFLDAYGALKLVSGRPNAPLCANRIITFDGSVEVQRTTGWAQLVVDPDSGFVPNVLHGGRTIDLYSGNPLSGISGTRYALQPTGWSSLGGQAARATPPFGMIDGSVLNSRYGYSHNGDTVAAAVWRQADGMIDVHLSIPGSGTPFETLSTPVQVTPISTTPLCVVQDSFPPGYLPPGVPPVSCEITDVGQTGEQVGVQAAWLPANGDLFLLIRYHQHTYALSEWYVCGGSDSTFIRSCRDRVQIQDSRRTEVRRFDRDAQQWSAVATPEYLIEQLASSEDGGEVAYMRYVLAQNDSLYWREGANGEAQAIHKGTSRRTDCAIDFANSANGMVFDTRGEVAMCEHVEDGTVVVRHVLGFTIGS